DQDSLGSLPASSAFLAGAFLAAAFFVGSLWAGAFLAAAFLAAAFLAGAFLAPRARRVWGPAARRSANSSDARSIVIDSTLSPRRSEALTVPSVTYGPKRPSRTTTARFVSGSA